MEIKAYMGKLSRWFILNYAELSSYGDNGPLHMLCSELLDRHCDIKRGTRTSKFNTADKNAALKTARTKMKKSEREKWSHANSITVKSAAQ